MLPGAENLDGWNAGLHDAIEQSHSQAMIDEQVRG